MVRNKDTVVIGN